MHLEVLVKAYVENILISSYRVLEVFVGQCASLDMNLTCLTLKNALIGRAD